jgi:hypothetical protein
MASTTQTTTSTTELPTDVTTPNISTPAETSLRMQIRVLTEKLEILEGILKGDNTIGIKGLSHLRTPAFSNGSWEDRLYALFFEARIPLPWFYEMVPAENEPGDSDIEFTYIYFINEAVKNESLRRLKLFLQTQYPNYEITIIN